MTEARAPRITADPGVMVGKPVIRGTRLTVETILRKLAQGISPEELLKDYPNLEREDILACLEYAVDALLDERIYGLPS